MSSKNTQVEDAPAAAITRRDFLKTASTSALALALGGGLSAKAGAAPARKPNIVLILADDLGYAELGVQGCKDIPTPNIDSIAKNGVRFTNGYVSCPVCSPTRAGLMTGRYQQRFGHEFNPGPPTRPQPDFGLALSETTIAERLKGLGYVTGMFGKWHLGFEPRFQPQQRGFDEFFGFLGGMHHYLSTNEDPNNPILRSTKTIDKIDYTTDAFAREAASFIERHHDKPFFLYLPFNAVHAPLESTQKYLDRFSSIADKKRRTFAAMNSAMDDAVGRVLAKLREHKLEENTLIFFISDNGGPTKQTTSGNEPLRGFKGQVFEGGIRIPFLMQWKGQIPAGETCHEPVISLDALPTAITAAGGHVNPDMKLDGVDLIPYLTGKSKAKPHDRLFWRFGAQWAVRAGDWKLESQGQGGTHLFNLKDDIGEKNDLSEQNPTKVKELQAIYDEWNVQLMKPGWGRGGATQP
jgi:arylsulfatase A-like enzyme